MTNQHEILDDIPPNFLTLVLRVIDAYDSGQLTISADQLAGTQIFRNSQLGQVVTARALEVAS